MGGANPSGSQYVDKLNLMNWERNCNLQLDGILEDSPVFLEWFGKEVVLNKPLR